LQSELKRVITDRLLHCPGSPVLVHTQNGRYTGQPALAGTTNQKLEDSVGAKFHCRYALADGK